MNSFWAEVDGEPINLNQSRAQLYNACHRKYYWQFEVDGVGLVPDRPQWALNLGTAIHDSLAKVHAGELLPSQAAENALQKFTGIIEPQVPRFIEGDDEKYLEAKETIAALMPAYYAHYGEDAFPWTPLGIEAKGRVEVGDNTGVFLVFRTDLLVVDQGRIWLVDHKTMKKLDERDMMKYEMDMQVSAYIYGVMAILQKPVAGVIVNGLVKTKTPQFVRDRYTRSLDELREFESEFVELAREIKMRRQRVRAGEDFKTVFYKNPQQCFQYGTCWYRELCLRDNDARRALYIHRKEDYVDNPRLLERAAGESVDNERSRAAE